MSLFLDSLAQLIHFGFGYVLCDDGSALFEMELATGEVVLVRLSSDAIQSGEDTIAKLTPDERHAQLFSWMAMMEIESENAYRCTPPELRRGAIFEVA